MPQQTIASLCKAASLALRKAGLAKEDGNEADQRAHLQKFMSLVTPPPPCRLWGESGPAV